uniref:PstS family phosphate ABC transporter substrate-binding protein n=1 Tax=Actinomyces sp. TaxID=29317 RepID=UPI0028A0C541
MSLRSRFTRTGVVLGAGALVASLAACGSSAESGDDASGDSASGSDASTTELSGSLAGAGASSQEAAMEAWKAGFSAQQPDVTLSYDAVGSGAGITQFTDGQVAWAGSDAPLEGDEVAAAAQRC